jgi:hypothetical protein
LLQAIMMEIRTFNQGKVPGDSPYTETDYVVSSEEENEEVQPRNKRVQKTAYREAVHAERSVNNTGINMTHNQNSKVDISDQADPTARGDQKGKKGV